MPDIALLPETIGALADIQYSSNDILTDGGFETAVYISLFTDAFDPESGDGGYWADEFDDTPMGSLLWTLARTVITPALPGQVVTICENALQWLIDCGAADAVTVTAAITGQFSVGISITITQAAQQSQYSYNWSSQGMAGF